MARNETFNIGSGVGVSIWQAASAIADLTGARVESVPWPDGYIEVETGDYVTGIAKAQRDLGFRPKRSFLEGIAETVEGYRAAQASNHGGTAGLVPAGRGGVGSGREDGR